MSRRAALFRQSDIRTAVKGAEATGREIAGIELRQDGTVFVRFGKPLAANESAPHDELDEIIERAKAQNDKNRRAN